jgi:hypothetical protein
MTDNSPMKASMFRGRRRIIDDDIKIRVPIYTYKGLDIYNENEFQGRTYSITLDDLWNKCVIYGSQVVWKEGLPEKILKDVQEHVVSPYDLWNYYGACDLDEDPQTKELVMWYVRFYQKLADESNSKNVGSL